MLPAHWAKRNCFDCPMPKSNRKSNSSSCQFTSDDAAILVRFVHTTSCDGGMSQKPYQSKPPSCTYAVRCICAAELQKLGKKDINPLSKL